MSNDQRYAALRPRRKSSFSFLAYSHLAPTAPNLRICQVVYPGNLDIAAFVECRIFEEVASCGHFEMVPYVKLFRSVQSEMHNELSQIRRTTHFGCAG